jgi:hypothetical protein
VKAWRWAKEWLVHLTVVKAESSETREWKTNNKEENKCYWKTNEAPIFICNLLTDRASDYTAPNDSVAINNQLEGMWREVVVTWFINYPGKFPGETKENYQNVSLTGVPAEIRSVPSRMGARGSVVGWGIMLPTWRSWVRFQMRSLDFFFSLPNPSSRNMALGSTYPLTEMRARNLPGG